MKWEKKLRASLVVEVQSSTAGPGNSKFTRDGSKKLEERNAALNLDWILGNEDGMKFWKFGNSDQFT